MQKVKDVAQEAAWVAIKTTKVMERASYERGMEDTEIRLVKEEARVCRDYYIKTWIKVLNSAGVLADSKLRKAKSIFFLEHI